MSALGTPCTCGVGNPSKYGERHKEGCPCAARSPIMKYFSYAHLPEKLQIISQDICELARKMDDGLPDGPEKSAGLRKLLEAKDCFVRTAL